MDRSSRIIAPSLSRVNICICRRPGCSQWVGVAVQKPAHDSHFPLRACVRRQLLSAAPQTADDWKVFSNVDDTSNLTPSCTRLDKSTCSQLVLSKMPIVLGMLSTVAQNQFLHKAEVRNRSCSHLVICILHLQCLGYGRDIWSFKRWQVTSSA